MVISLHPGSLCGLVPVPRLSHGSKPRDSPVCLFSEIILCDISFMGPT